MSTWKQYRIAGVKRHTGERVEGVCSWDGLSSLHVVTQDDGSTAYLSVLDDYEMTEVDMLSKKEDRKGIGRRIGAVVRRGYVGDYQVTVTVQDDGFMYAIAAHDRSGGMTWEAEGDTVHDTPDDALVAGVLDAKARVDAEAASQRSCYD